MKTSEQAMRAAAKSVGYLNFYEGARPLSDREKIDGIAVIIDREMCGWRPIEGANLKAGHYLVGSDLLKICYQARWMPLKKQWKFPSAAMAFDPTHYQLLPTL